MTPDADLITFDSPDAICAAIAAFAQGAPGDRTASLDDEGGLKAAGPLAALQTHLLIDHIIERYHRVHMAEFPQAVALARKVEAVHALEAECPHGLADHLALMADDLAGHQRKEERVLFPMMREGGDPMLPIVIARMQLEHGDVQEQLIRLAALTKDFSPPPNACGSWRSLNQMCRKLSQDLREHMQLEDEMLFAPFLHAIL